MGVSMALSKNGKFKVTINNRYTRHRTNINVRENRRGNQKWKSRVTWHHRVHKMKKKKQHSTICVGHHANKHR
jgi:hypothetical protein